jgi:DNA excision repair protein ERCC-2
VRIEEYFAYDPLRPGQRDLAVRVMESCVRGGLLLAEARSGFGKTAAVLAGAIAAADQTGCRVVYTCRTKRQITRVIEELAALQGRRTLEAAHLTSKFDYCLLKDTSSAKVKQASFGWFCGFNTSNNLCSYFLNVPLKPAEVGEAVEQISKSVPEQGALLSRSAALHVCPYELARLAAARGQTVVVPYNYVFGRGSALVEAGIEPRRTILVIDEAHNIRDFLTSSLSSRLLPGALANAIDEAKTLQMERAGKSLAALQTYLGEPSGPEWRIDRQSLLDRISRERGETWLQDLTFELSSCAGAAWAAVAYGRRMPDMILKVAEFLERLLTGAGDASLAAEDGALMMVPANPVAGLPDALRGFRSTVLVSATMNPIDVFVRSLGIDQVPLEVYRASEGPVGVVKTILDTGVTTRYSLRGPEMSARISEKVGAVVAAAREGVGIFLPSYAMMAPIEERLRRRFADRNIVCEARGMSAGEASATIHSYKSVAGSVLLGVQGGRFSEGEDFGGDSMEAVVVVGLALPPPSPELFEQYARLKMVGERSSYMMLSLLPAVRKAFQSAGRHLRSPEKRGMVFLLDKRFDQRPVRDLMPPWMRADVTAGDFTPAQIQSLVRDFQGGAGS